MPPWLWPACSLATLVPLALLSVAGFTAPAIADTLGRTGLPTTLARLAVVAVLFAVAGREAPGQATSPVAFRTRLRHAVRLRTARDLAGLYAIAFGVYLPHLPHRRLRLATAAGGLGGFLPRS